MLKRHVRVVSAHGRITGWVLSGLPLALGGMLGVMAFMIHQPLTLVIAVRRAEKVPDGQRAAEVELVGAQAAVAGPAPLDRDDVGERVLDGERAAEALDILGSVWTLDAVEAAGGGGDEACEIGHGRSKG